MHLLAQKWGVLGLQSGNTPRKHLKSKGFCVCWKVTKPQLTQEPTHVAMHMRPSQRIRLSLSLQAPFSLCASPALCDLLLARGRPHSRSRGGHAQRRLALCAGGLIILGAAAHAALRAVGCPSRPEWDK